MTRKRLLVTGLSGLVGQYLQRLVGTTHELYHLGRRPLSDAQICHVPLDLAGPWDSACLPPKADAIIHLAQSPDFRRFPEAAEGVFGVNVASVAKLLAHAQRCGIPQVILASSGGVYAPNALPFKESDPLQPDAQLGHYLATKLASEVLAYPYRAHLSVIILRFFFIYGPEQQADMLLPRLAHRILRGESIDLVGEEGLRFNPIHAEDAARSVLAALALSGSHTLNVAGPESLSLRAAANWLGKGLQKEALFRVIEGESPSMVGDLTQQRAHLGAPTILPSRALPALGEHVRAHSR